MGSRLFVAVFCLEDPSPGTHISFELGPAFERARHRKLIRRRKAGR